MHRLIPLINEGNEALVAEFLERYGPRLAYPSQVRLGFEKRTQMGRLAAVLLTLQECAFGADTLSALSLSDSLLTYFIKHLDTLPTQDLVLAHFYATAINCAVYANFQEGNWDHALALTSQPTRDFPQLTQQPIYWNAIGTQARILIRRNSITEAEAILAPAPQDLFHQDNQLATAQNEMLGFIQRRFEVDTRPTISEQTSAIWKRDIPKMCASMVELRQHDIARARAEGIAPSTAFFDHIIDSLAKAERVIDGDLPFETKRRAISQATYDFQEALRRYQSPHGDFDRVTFDWVSRCLHRVATFLDQEELHANLQRVLHALDLAEHWVLTSGDLHSELLIDWMRLLILDHGGHHTATAQPVERILSHLYSARANAMELEVKSAIANFFPDLPRRALLLAEHPQSVIYATDSCELRRERSLLAATANPRGSSRLSQAKPASLGQNVHYMGFTSLHTSREIYAHLYCADGTVLQERIELSLDQVYRQIPRLDPAEWTRPNLFRPKTLPPPDAFSPLLLPLGRALDTGRIRQDDHVCIAADDPLHLIPFQYIQLHRAPAVKWVSMSRCASFADACLLACTEEQHPCTAAAMFVAAADEKHPRAKHHVFSQIVGVLTSTLPSRPAVIPDATREGVFEALSQFDLVHIDAHGAFDPTQNPWEFSGLLVADKLGPPVRDGRSHCLLTPRQVYENHISIKSRDICLNACVSGLGLPGKGGDVLGMEFVLRISGARSILASHWNIEWAKSSTFFAEYYTRWLGQHMPRCRAWRESILSLLEQDEPHSVPESWTAFSLFGSWR